MAAIKNQTDNWKVALSQIRNYLVSLLKDYVGFLTVLLKPLSLLSLVLTGLTIFFSQNQTGTIRVLLEILATVLGSITGGIVTYNVAEYTGNIFVVKKSESAIRNLQLLALKARNVSERVETLRSEDNGRDFDEIENLIENIRMDIYNSIGDWADVNPRAGVVTGQYELVSEIRKVKLEKRAIQSELSQTRDTTAEQTRELKGRLSEKDEEIANLQKQLDALNKRTLSVIPSLGSVTGLSYLSGATGSPVYLNTNPGVTPS